MQKTKPKSAKEILLGHDFLAQRIISAKYVHHEFQDYAYRLAVELHDLQHRSLYMRIAKSVPRHLIERAYALTKDSKEIHKAKLFMWHLKQLREQEKLKKDNVNFEYDFVLKRMGQLFDALVTSLMKKFQIEATGDEQRAFLGKVFNYMSELKPLPPRKKLSALVLDSRGGYVSNLIAAQGWKTMTNELSRELIKSINQKYPTLKATRSTFTNGKFKPQSFDLLWVGDFWKLVSLEAEQKIAKEFDLLLSQSGLLLINFNAAEEISEAWVEFGNGEKRFRYLKNQSKEILLQIFSGYKVLESGENYLLLCK